MMHDSKKNRTTSRWAGIAAAVVLILGSAFGFSAYNTNHAVDATVSLDVNPSVEISANRHDRVLHVTANNTDGQIILGDMDFKGSSLEVAVNALIGSMVRNGYLNELANSVLLSVDSDDPVRSAELQSRLTEEINALLQTDTFSGAVLSQTITEGTTLQSAADQYGITLGKAQLIQEIIDQDTRYDFDTLADLSINELSLIHHHDDTDYHSDLSELTIVSTGTTSDKAYIGADTAKTAALEYAGIPESDARGLYVEYDYEWGTMVYEVEFNAGSYEYSIDVDALTGEILGQEKEWDDDGYLEDLDDVIDPENLLTAPQNSVAIHTDNHHDNTEHAIVSTETASDTAYIDLDAAKAAAFDHAGVSAAEVRGISCELDEERGTPVYEIEFRAGSYEYSYEVAADDGSILEREKEWAD